MKRILTFILAAVSALAIHGAESPVNVQKLSSDSTLTGSIVVPPGKSITATGNGTITATATSLAAPLPVNQGGTGTTTPSLVQGSNITITGTWPNQTITGTAGGITALTGDVTASGTGSVAATLATVNSNVGTFGNATQTAQMTVNAKGLTTAATNVTITPAVGSITGFGTGVATFLATPSSANLLAAVTDETGTGALVFAGNSTLTGNTSATNITASTAIYVPTNTSTNAGIYWGVGNVSHLAYNGSQTFLEAAGGLVVRTSVGGSTGLTVSTALDVTAGRDLQTSNGKLNIGITNTQAGAGVTNYGAAIISTVNQTGAADFRDVVVYHQTTAAGGGMQLVFDAQVGASTPGNNPSVASIDTAGTFKSSGAWILRPTIFTSAGNYTVTATDQLVIVNKGTGAATGITLTSSPVTGRAVIVMDGKGDAATNNITISPASGTINGLSSIPININYQSLTFVYNGTQWNQL